MRILFAANDLSKIGGIQKYNIDFLSALENGDDSVSVIELKGRNFLSKVFFSFKVIIYGIFGKFNVLALAHINFLSLGYFLNLFFKKKFIVLTYGIDVWNLNKKQIQYLKKAEKISVISKFTLDKIRTQVKNIDDKFFILPNAINGDEFFPKKKAEHLVKKYNLKNKKIIFTLCRISSLEKYKGYDQVIASLPKVLKKISNVKYILAGAGDDIGRIKDMIKKLELENCVVLTGYISKDELIDYYNLADIFAMPSKGEGFGFVFLEALACGKPVIAGNIDGSVDAVLDGEIGVLVNPDNTTEIGETIINILERKVDSRLLDSDYLRKKVLEIYGIDKFRRKVKNLIYDLSR